MKEPVLSDQLLQEPPVRLPEISDPVQTPQLSVVSTMLTPPPSLFIGLKIVLDLERIFKVKFLPIELE